MYYLYTISRAIDVIGSRLFDIQLNVTIFLIFADPPCIKILVIGIRTNQLSSLTIVSLLLIQFYSEDPQWNNCCEWDL